MKARGEVWSVIVCRPPEELAVYGGIVQFRSGMSACCARATPAAARTKRKARILTFLIDNLQKRVAFEKTSTRICVAIVASFPGAESVGAAAGTMAAGRADGVSECVFSVAPPAAYFGWWNPSPEDRSQSI